jgi:hypothetical protein
MGDTSKHFKDYLKERMAFTIEFVNDTAAILNDENKKITGTYKFDNETSEDEKEGIKLRISYRDSSVSFPGAAGPMIMTYTFAIAGADEKALLMELPRSYNNRKVAVLMQPRQ